MLKILVSSQSGAVRRWIGRRRRTVRVPHPDQRRRRRSRAAVGTPGAGESSKFLISILTEIKNRGVGDIFYLVCDGLKGMPDSVHTVLPATILETLVVHLIRNTFKYSSKKYWAEFSRDLKPVCTAVNADAALAGFETFEEKWGTRYPAIRELWGNNAGSHGGGRFSTFSACHSTIGCLKPHNR